MGRFLLLTLAASFFALHIPGLRAQEQDDEPVSIPLGKLAFVTSENFGTGGEISLMVGKDLTPTMSFKTRELEFLPDGKRIIYCVTDLKAKTQGIHIYDLGNHTSTPVLTNVANAESPSWSPDGTKIAFVKYPAGRESSQIYTANVNGSQVRQLTVGQFYNWNPRWSRNGKHLVFETTRNDSSENHVAGGHRDIYRMDVDGRNQTNLTEGAYGHSPSWSPDGKFIAYMARGSVWIMKADGSDKQNISHASTRDSEPAWAPDGQWIAFTRTMSKPPGPETMNIWIMKGDGTEQRQITFNQNNSASFSPSWSR